MKEWNYDFDVKNVVFSRKEWKIRLKIEIKGKILISKWNNENRNKKIVGKNEKELD